MMEYINDRQILILYGLRRVGKTTLLYQFIDELLSRGVKAEHILYFSFDEIETKIDDLILAHEENILRSPIGDAGKIYLILDEIQKARDWENRVKIFYDLHPNIKFIISGSASLNVKRRSGETLAGRIYSVYIVPLSFEEFREIKGIHLETGNWRVYENTIKPFFMDYAFEGGFSELVNEEREEKILSYIREIVLDRIILIDIPEEFGVRDLSLLKTLVEMVASDPGLILNYDSLSRKLGKSKQTLMNYIFYLEYSLVVKTIKNLRPGFLATSRKMRKIYFTNSAFQSAIKGLSYDDPEKSVKNMVMQSADLENYYREGNDEIDFLWIRKGQVIPVELKYGAYQLDRVVGVLKKIGLHKGIIVSKDQYAVRKKEEVEIQVIPIWLFVLFNDRLEEIR